MNCCLQSWTIELLLVGKLVMFIPDLGSTENSSSSSAEPTGLQIRDSDSKVWK